MVIKDIDDLVLAETGGVIINHNWYAGNDQFFFCRGKVDTLDGFAGKKTRSRSAALPTGSTVWVPVPSFWPSPRFTPLLSAAFWTAAFPATTQDTGSAGTGLPTISLARRSASPPPTTSSTATCEPIFRKTCSRSFSKRRPSWNRGNADFSNPERDGVAQKHFR